MFRKARPGETPLLDILRNTAPVVDKPAAVVDTVVTVVDRKADRHKGSRTDYYRTQKRKKRAEAKA